MGIVTSRRLSRRKLKRQCLRTALVIVFLSMICEGISNDRAAAPSASFVLPTKPRSYAHPPGRHNSIHPNHLRRGLFRRRRDGNDETTQQSQPQEETVDSLEDESDESFFLRPPPPPRDHLPLRFLRAGKNDPAEGWRRYQATLQWRQEEGIDTLLREPFADFDLIRQNYQQYFHLTGRQGQPVFYEIPAKTNVQALKQGGVDTERFLRFYTFLTEFQWQMLCPDDHAQSIYVVDLDGIRVSDFVGDTRKFVINAARLSALHYPERGGKVLLINVPRWFQVIWRVLRPIVDESTLDKISILRGEDEIRQALLEHIPMENIPREYGGTSETPLGEAPEEKLLTNLITHNNLLALEQEAVCRGCQRNVDPQEWPCDFCRWTPVRSY